MRDYINEDLLSEKETKKLIKTFNNFCENQIKHYQKNKNYIKSELFIGKIEGYLDALTHFLCFKTWQEPRKTADNAIDTIRQIEKM